ncbi:hypothetical protein SERLADRAFT_411810 [Serpula lacrymans var. lacrymans S7.9]|uniref:DDE Tnp4 domain-containing protein n=1 Tax=Serpula lacrymans var. lacrymans (strain S7.9) TaxID=578457 RepID=F8PCD7_SERL9|nr:uncharacterized protein SERLADRAFT_411810 [Serpula lacrymans var. lacrymans S7.9]EGO19335.1 hypothetical protein SERLADRAFT_411810 [Serpula lacrymans var. lacrymans S7.9]
METAADLADWASVSVGSVELCTKRTMITVLSLHDEMISPPTDEEKAEVKRWVKKQVCEAWENGYLQAIMVKHSLTENQTTLNAQITTLPHNLKIVDYGLGHTGSIHDLSAFRDTTIYQTPEKFFTAGEWLWGDSAYPVSPTCVSPFKRVPNQCCFILHNFIIRMEGQDHNSRNNINRDWQLELDELLADGVEDVGDNNGKNMPVNLPRDLREKLVVDLFSSSLYCCT